MPIAGSKTTPAGRLYSGTAPCRIIAVNPDRKAMRELFGTFLDYEPRYTGVSRNGTRYGSVKVCLEAICPEKTPLRLMLTVCVYKSMYRRPGTDDEWCACDKYGMLSWCRKDRLRSESKRFVHIGEDGLITLARAALEIPFPEPGMKPHELSMCQCRLDTVNDIIAGDPSELSEALLSDRQRKVVCLVGVRTDADGVMTQCVFPRMFAPQKTRSLEAFRESVSRARLNSPFLRPDYYEISPLHAVREEDVLEWNRQDFTGPVRNDVSPIYDLKTLWGM